MNMPAVAIDDQDARELALVECYWDIVEASQGKTGGEALLGIARQSINFEDNMLDFIKSAVDGGATLESAIEQVRRGAHMATATGQYVIAIPAISANDRDR